MPTTNISQILSSILTPDTFSRKDQRLRVMAYTLSLPLPKHINESTISKYGHISHTLSSHAISTQSITHSRIEYMLQFLNSIITLVEDKDDECA